MGKKNNIDTAILIGIVFGVSFGFLISLFIDIIKDIIVYGFLTTLVSENLHYNFSSQVNLIIIIVSTFCFVLLSVTILCKTDKNEKREKQVETAEQNESRIRENLNVLSMSNDWDSFFLSQENLDYFLQPESTNFFVDILVKNTLKEIEEKKRINNKPTITAYESYISQVANMEKPHDSFNRVFCWSKNILCENLIYKMRVAETYENYVCYNLAYQLVDKTCIIYRLVDDIDFAFPTEVKEHHPFGFLYSYFSCYTLNKNAWNLLVEAKSITGVPQISITGVPQIDNKTVPHIWSEYKLHIWNEYELYERYLYTLGEQSKVDYNENQQSIGIKVALTFIEWSEEKKRKIEEKNRRLEAYRKRKDAELKYQENIHKTNISYSTRGCSAYMNIPKSVCLSCGGTGFHEHTDYYGNFIRDFCPDCNGTGYLGGYAGDPSGTLKARCISCGGMGFYEYTNNWGGVERRRCVDCRGTGYMIPGWGT